MTPHLLPSRIMVDFAVLLSAAAAELLSAAEEAALFCAAELFDAAELLSLLPHPVSIAAAAIRAAALVRILFFMVQCNPFLHLSFAG